MLCPTTATYLSAVLVKEKKKLDANNTTKIEQMESTCCKWCVAQLAQVP